MFAWLPNFITFVRLLLIPVFVYCMFGVENGILAALVVFILSGVTDVLDGTLARAFHWESAAGKVLDPLADKSMQLAVFITLVAKKMIPGWVVFLLMLKEGLMVIAGVALWEHKVVVQSNWSGKLATVVMYVSVTIIILFQIMSVPLPHFVEIILWLTIVGTALMAFLCYFFTYKKELAKLKG